jgi:hypothetical protein
MLRKWAKIIATFDRALDVVQHLISTAIEYGREPDDRLKRRADRLKTGKRIVVEKERAAALSERSDAFGDSESAIARYNRTMTAAGRRMPAHHDTVDAPAEAPEEEEGQ